MKFESAVIQLTNKLIVSDKWGATLLQSVQLKCIVTDLFGICWLHNECLPFELLGLCKNENMNLHRIPCSFNHSLKAPLLSVRSAALRCICDIIVYGGLENKGWMTIYNCLLCKDQLSLQIWLNLWILEFGRVTKDIWRYWKGFDDKAREIFADMKKPYLHYQFYDTSIEEIDDYTVKNPLMDRN